MNNILFKIFPVLKKHMSNHASNLLSGFGLIALLVLALYLVSLSGFTESSGLLFIIFLAATTMIPISFLVLWILEIKHEWDMRVVTVILQNGKPFPQNAIYAKRSGYKFRRLTKEEKISWGLDKKESLSVILKKLLFVTNEEIESKRQYKKLNAPDLPMEAFKRIRNEQARKRIEKKNS
ncbi:MAG: hypothetical protein PF484_00040 [Bacteroidales bacterium]|jgi:hypothetical protein|nr:hypothetical protein [Bacteroidales bacterium]